ncbi:MAG: glycoside hydrolase family 26 protein [Bifidobacteriaceae bacterium]|jgi:mannan endo-1,4-beta-mannosidase|nr:glycoside hydrolase family 26 protein [Bifidobacteriaceae bacterium]
MLGPIDEEATESVVRLYARLRSIEGKYALFGHQSDFSIKRAADAESDTVEATGTYPAVFGFDVGGIETKHDGPELWAFEENLRTQMQKVDRLGGIITVSWHSVNPITGGGYGHNMADHSIRAVLPEGSRHESYREQIDRASRFFKSLVSEDGSPIPVVWRPYHEHNGDWFWWCIGRFDGEIDNEEAEFIDLWKMTQSRFMSNGVHNLLYASSPDRSRFGVDDYSRTGYFRGYPGDEYVDILGLDDYIDIGRFDNSGTRETIYNDFVHVLTRLSEAAARHGKMSACTEIGTPNDLAGAGVKPWTGFLDKAARANTETKKILWYLTWTNSMKPEETNIYGNPLSSDATGADFKEFARTGYIRFLDRN